MGFDLRQELTLHSNMPTLYQCFDFPLRIRLRFPPMVSSSIHVYWCTLLPLPTVVIVSPPFPLFFRRMQLCLQALGSGDGFQGWLISKAHVLTILSLRLKYRRGERLRHSACSTQPIPTTSEPKLLQCYFVTRHVRQTDEEWELIREATHHAKFC